MPEPLPIPYVRDICQPGQGTRTCRYLVRPKEWECLKLTYFKLWLDERVALDTILAHGDNCDGRP